MDIGIEGPLTRTTEFNITNESIIVLARENGSGRNGRVRGYQSIREVAHCEGRKNGERNSSRHGDCRYGPAALS